MGNIGMPGKNRNRSKYPDFDVNLFESAERRIK